MPKKAQNYRDLVQQKSIKYTNITFINLSMSALGIIDKCTSDFLDMLINVQFDIATKNCMLRKITTFAIRESYYIFRTHKAKSGLILNSYLISFH